MQWGDVVSQWWGDVIVETGDNLSQYGRASRRPFQGHAVIKCAGTSWWQDANMFAWPSRLVGHLLWRSLSRSRNPFSLLRCWPLGPVAAHRFRLNATWQHWRSIFKKNTIFTVGSKSVCVLCYSNNHSRVRVRSQTHSAIIKAVSYTTSYMIVYEFPLAEIICGRS